MGGIAKLTRMNAPPRRARTVETATRAWSSAMAQSCAIPATARTGLPAQFANETSTSAFRRRVSTVAPAPSRPQTLASRLALSCATARKASRGLRAPRTWTNVSLARARTAGSASKHRAPSSIGVSAEAAMRATIAKLSSQTQEHVLRARAKTVGFARTLSPPPGSFLKESSCATVSPQITLEHCVTHRATRAGQAPVPTVVLARSERIRLRVCAPRCGQASCAISRVPRKPFS